MSNALPHLGAGVNIGTLGIGSMSAPRSRGTRYFTTTPITGTAALSLNKTAPMLAIGFGNLLPRNGRHFQRGRSGRKSVTTSRRSSTIRSSR